LSRLSPMATTLVDELSEEVRCALCLELFEDPRFLQCGHTFCFECLKGLEVRKTINCPLCRKVHHIGKGTINDLMKNLYVANIVQKIQSVKANTKETPQIVPNIYNFYCDSVNPSSVTTVQPSEIIERHEKSQITDSSLRLERRSVPPQLERGNLPVPLNSSNSNVYLPYIPQQLQSPNMLPSTHPATVTTSSSSTVSNTPTVPAALTPRGSSVTPGRKRSFTNNVLSGLFSLFGNNVNNQESSNSGSNVELSIKFASFNVKYDDVCKCLSKWMSSLWFAPCDYYSRVKVGPIQSVYIPFWTFDLSINSVYSGEVIRIEKIDNNKTVVTDRRKATGSRASHYKDMTVLGDRLQDESVVRFIRKFDDWKPTKASHSHPQSCCNLQSPASMPIVHEYESAEHILQNLTGTIKETEKKACQSKLKSEQLADQIEDFQLTVELLNVSKRIIYMPAYIGTYVFEGKTMTFLVNGQSGMIQGERAYGLGTLGKLLSN